MVNEVSLARTQEALAGRYSTSMVKGPIGKVTSVAFQVRFWALDLLMAEKGRTCQFLREDCCFFVNASGMVQNKVRELRESIRLGQAESDGFDFSGW